ncbi:carboxypeptidase-like regulatory domain-containing protein [Streptomyces sp. NPDC093018]|uniref:MSCRAMM family protein n=1 Tax=Streptomyces sp. NPDC093018 TaxID=3155067 RepID=UPI00342494E2
MAAGSPSSASATATTAPDSHPATEDVQQSAEADGTATATTAALSPGVLRGRVFDSAGRPIARAALTLVDRSGRQRALASTGADGTYELTMREPSSYTLVVSATGHHPRAVQLDAEAGPVVPDVTLAGLGNVHGTVRHEHTGQPVPDAQITLLSSSGEVVASAATDPDGAYTLQNLAPGTYTVVTSGYGPVLADVTLGEGNSCEVDLEVGHHETD